MTANRLPLNERLGDRLAVPLAQLGLVLEQLELAGPAGHEEEDDALRLRRPMPRPRGERVIVSGGDAAAVALIQERSERDGAQSDAANLRRNGGASVR